MIIKIKTVQLKTKQICSISTPEEYTLLNVEQRDIVEQIGIVFHI